MKVGPGQLMSAQAGEALGTIRTAMNRIKGCKGYDSETKTGTDCNTNFGENQVLVDKMHKIKDEIAEVFVKTNLGEGTGPIGWWTAGNISGQKPSWWDAHHPNWDWEDAKGTDPNKNMGKFKNLSKDDRRKIIEARDGMRSITDKLNEVFNSGEFGELIKQHIMYEAMTGCGKFCPECCGIEVCDDCDAAAKATHLIVANKDGTGGMIEEIGKPKSTFMDLASLDTTSRVDFKTTQPKKTVNSWINDTNPDIASKIQLPSRSKPKMTALKDAHKNQTKEWEARKLTKTQDKQIRQHLEKSGTNIKEYEWSGMPKREQTKVLKKAKIYSNIKAAIDSYDIVYASSARQRDINKKHLSFKRFIENIKKNKNKKIGIIFGPEASGLSNEDISHSNYIFKIPVSKNFESINLSHSLIIVCFELFKVFKPGYLKKQKKLTDIASKKTFNTFFDFLETRLEKKGFFSPKEKKKTMLINLRNIFGRMELSNKEVRILSSVFSKL